MPATPPNSKMTVMSITIPTSSTATGPLRLFRRVDGVEVPVAGTWTVPQTRATVDISVQRRLRKPVSRRALATEATLVFGDDPGELLVAVQCDVPGAPLPGLQSRVAGAPVRIVGRAVPGLQRWSLLGDVFTGVGLLPLRASLDYRGVWRHGDGAYGWFVLTANAAPPTGSSWRLRFDCELLAYGPQDLTTVTAPSRLFPVTQTTHTGGAA
jgi:hypothetical protein